MVNPYYDSGFNCTLEKKQLQKKFKHAKVFGIDGNFNKKIWKFLKVKLFNIYEIQELK